MLRDTQSLNALEPMLVSVEGILNAFRAAHPLNACESMVCRPLAGILTLSNAVHILKAILPIRVSVLGSFTAVIVVF